MSESHKAGTLPTNFPTPPARHSLALFRLQLDAATRYLFEGEIRELLTDAGIPLDVLTRGSDPALNVAQVAGFMQAVRGLIGSEKAFSFGHESFLKVLPTLARPSLPPLARTISTSDKLFLRMRDAMAVLNRQFDTNFLTKWHGGAEADIFEDSGLHCYGHICTGTACETATGFLAETIAQLAGIKMTLAESECMAMGALSCRWHCKLP